MNATCSAGILQPQRVSDLGRLLNSEITAPLDSTARGVCNTSMAPAHLQGALFNICMAPAHLQGALTSPCARQFFIPTRGSVCPPTFKGGNFLIKSTFPKKRTFLIKSTFPKKRGFSLISPLEMPDDARCASAQRRRSFPSTSNSKFSYLPFLSSITILVTTYSIHARSEITNDARTRRHSTTKLRVHVDKTPGRSLPKHSAPPFRLLRLLRCYCKRTISELESTILRYRYF